MSSHRSPLASKRTGRKTQRGQQAVPDKPAVKDTSAEDALIASLLTSPPVVFAPPSSLCAFDHVHTPTLKHILHFCCPNNVQHPLSTGRLAVYAEHGPLCLRHNFHCLCTHCKTSVREASKNGDAFAKQVELGKLFNQKNCVRASRKSTAITPPLSPFSPLAKTLKRQDFSDASPDSEPAHDDGRAALANTLPLKLSLPLPCEATYTQANSSNTFSFSSSSSSPAPTTPTPASPSHNNHSSLSYPLLPPLCKQCYAHLSSGHLLCGVNGSLIVGERELDQMAKRSSEEDLLKAYGRFQQLSPADERAFFTSLSKWTLARSQYNYTPQQIEQLLGDLISPDGLMSFQQVSERISEDRRLRIERLSQMYPDVSTKGEKNLATSTMGWRADEKIKEMKQEKEKWKAQMNKSSSGQLEWKGSSILSTSMLGKKYPPHHCHLVATRLLHKHTHQIATLDQVRSSSTALNVHMMRNDYQTNKQTGWTSSTKTTGIVET